MTEPRNLDPVTIDLALPETVAAVRSRFAAAWQEALRGTSPPRIADYLAGFQDPDRTLLIHVLERIDADFRNGGTIDQQHGRGNGDVGPSARTVDVPRPDSSTVD